MQQHSIQQDASFKITVPFNGKVSLVSALINWTVFRIAFCSVNHSLDFHTTYFI